MELDFGLVASTIIQVHLETEVNYSSNVWFARVPTEANIADIPSRFSSHAFLVPECEMSAKTQHSLERFLQRIKVVHDEIRDMGEAGHLDAPYDKKRRLHSSSAAVPTRTYDTMPKKAGFISKLLQAQGTWYQKNQSLIQTNLFETSLQPWSSDGLNIAL